MRIVRIELWHVAIPLPAPFRPAWIPGMAQRENRFDLIRLTTASGLQGWSAAPAMGDERRGVGSLLGPYFLGERADDIPSVRQRLREMGYLGWRLGFIEAACWDVIGRAEGRPVWRLLAEHEARQRGDPPPDAATPTLRLYASTGDVRSPSERIAEVERRLDEGFTAVKLRVHEDEERDLAHIREVRAAVGDGPRLMVDANQGWRVAVVADAPRWDIERARRFCEMAAEADLTWVEEPLPHDDYSGYAELRRALAASGHRVDIAGGELNSQGTPEFGTLLEHDCLDVYQPDAVFTGGISGTWEIVQRVRSAGRKYSPHTWTNGVGFAINLQLFAASGAWEGGLLEYPLVEPGWVPSARDGMLTAAWTHDRGALRAPEGPGLGFEIDERALARHGHRFFLGTKTRVAIRAVLQRGLAAAREIGRTRDDRLAKRSAEMDQQRADGAGVVDVALDAPLPR